MTSLKVKFGKRLKELRKSKGLTQEQVAEIINRSKISNGIVSIYSHHTTTFLITVNKFIYFFVARYFSNVSKLYKIIYRKVSF